MTQRPRPVARAEESDVEALAARVADASSQGAHAAAERWSRVAIAAQPDVPVAYFNHGLSLWNLDLIDAAARAFERTLAMAPAFPGALMNLAVSQLAPIYRDETDLHARRNRYEDLLRAWHAHVGAGGNPIAHAEANSGQTALPFKLAYQGLNDRALQRLHGEALCAIMGHCHPQWANRPPMPPPDADNRLRIGFASAFFYNHSNWKMPLAGWLAGLPRDRFRLFGYHLRDTRDACTDEAEAACDIFVCGTRDVAEWAERIRADRLHVLIYPEIGMSWITARLAALRLAPLQCTSWGHPSTSGMPSIDAFLSSDLMEPADGQDHYTETLVRLPNLSIAYTPQRHSHAAPGREDFGLSTGDVLFWCCQNLMKYLPQHDHVFAEIAAADERFRLVFIEASSPGTTEAFVRRLERVFADHGLRAAQRCVFLPRLSASRFLAATARMDIFLDAIGWSGCNSFMEALGEGLPAVCFAGETMRARHGAAMLMMMDLSEFIASDKAAYVDLAVRLGRDPALRRRYAAMIAERRNRLYGDADAVAGLAAFLTEAVAATGIWAGRTQTEALVEAASLHPAGHRERAGELYRRCLVERPHDAEALAGLGALALQDQRIADGTRFLERSVRAGPPLAKALVNLGTAYRLADRLLDAAAAYRQAWALDPSLVCLPDEPANR